MSIHNELLNLATNLKVPALKKTAEYNQARLEVADEIFSILDRYPLSTGHEWKLQQCFWSPDPNAEPEMREVCALCGTDRLLGDEARPCDNRVPEEFKPLPITNGW